MKITFTIDVDLHETTLALAEDLKMARDHQEGITIITAGRKVYVGVAGVGSIT